MAGNDQLIDQVISHVVDEQVATLDKLLKDLDIQMSKNIQSANQLNAVTGNSKSFKTLNEDATKTAIALEKVQQIQNRTAITANQLVISNNRVAASNNSVSASAAKAQGEYAKLLKSYNEATTAARNAGVQFGATSPQYLKAADNVKALRTQLDSIDQPLGNFQRNVGNYGNSIGTIFQKAFSGIRTLANIIPNFGIGTFFLLLGTGILKVVESLGLFNSVATQSEMVQKGLNAAFDDAKYGDAVKGIEELASSLDLVRTGVVDSDVAVNKYNETIGKTFGYVNNLNDAQQGFIDNQEAYIRAILQEATAQAILADSAKELAKLGKEQQDIRNTNRRLTDNTETDIFGQKVSADARYNFPRIEANNKKIVDLEKKRQEIIKNTIGSLDENASGTPNGGKNWADAVADMLNKIANDALERQKIVSQAIIGNDKKSYSDRISAAETFYKASRQIEENNIKNELDKLPEKDARREEIEKSGSNKLLQIEQDRIKAIQDLNDAAYKQDQEILKNNIQKQKDLQKSVLDDPNQSYPAKLGAIQLYNDRSKELIDANYKEQVKAAGENGKSIKLAEQNKAKSILQLDTETATTRLKIAKENLDKILQASKESEQDQIQAIDNASKQALRALDKVNSDKVNAISLQRAQGKITENKYNDELLAISDAYAIQRIQQEIITQQTILAIKEGRRDSTLALAKIDGATPEQLSKIASDANKDIQPIKDKIADAGISLGNAQAKQTIDQTKSGASDADKRRQDEIFAINETGKAVDGLDKLRQRAYENEIKRLEKLSEQIDENANNEKTQVNNSILSSATKARQIAVIDADTARQKKALQAQENKIKRQEAIADKESAIARIILETAVAAIRVVGQSGIFGLPLVPVVLALGAVELATAIATPLPTFAKGGKTPGGPVIWGEAGMESARLPSGEVRFSTGPEIANFPKGTVITPHMELMRTIKPAPVQYTGGEQIPWRELIKAVKDNKNDKRSRINVNVDLGYENYKRSYLNR